MKDKILDVPKLQDKKEKLKKKRNPWPEKETLWLHKTNIHTTHPYSVLQRVPHSNGTGELPLIQADWTKLA